MFQQTSEVAPPTWSHARASRAAPHTSLQGEEAQIEASPQEVWQLLRPEASWERLFSTSALNNLDFVSSGVLGPNLLAVELPLGAAGARQHQGQFINIMKCERRHLP